ncbi:glycoside hydrolase family 44 protein [Telmatospirillum sp.]|uniref:glycoside hydrolase family 44 protein n=1 Tax=Telmatospirillum sp. TaxID=2079197 RepID=UPI002846663B|nr:glycoside hydrolase family 44 protein [Telmatospirillum sp.]MDR3439120.1 glycoside hydrolase family 44 protein [Telmatospirillum sp.]
MPGRARPSLHWSALAVVLLGLPVLAAAGDVEIDGAAGHRTISPLIYGVSYATQSQLSDLNAPLNRSGGDSATRYNWRLDARNAGKDWFFESLACSADIFDQHGDGFVGLSKAAGAEPMLTMPMIGWVAKLDEGRKPLAAFSIGKYGLQQKSDLEGFVDAGNGLRLDGTAITNNDPNDASMPDGPDDERKWVEHLVGKWGLAGKGGVTYYAMDNEPSFWHDIHRDVHPIGAHAREIADKVATYATMVKAIDPGARVLAPEEWGWTAYRYSGFDQQYAVQHGFDKAPDRTDQTQGMDYLPWLLSQWKTAGHPVDVVSVHFYPQGGVYKEDGGDQSAAGQLLRNRSTRDLWDPDYLDPTWIHDKVALIPRLRRWVDSYYYPGTPIAITEYNWGAEKTMNGATAQADALGIFGREGLDLATRWATPPTDSPTYLAMKLYRNYDGRKSGFGETSIATRTADPDRLAAFAALRAADGAMTVMVIDKDLSGDGQVDLKLRNFASRGTVEAYQLADGRLTHLPPAGFAESAFSAKVPAPSVTLFVLKGAGS